MEGEDCHFFGPDWPMTDGDYIRQTDYKEFDPESSPREAEASRGAYLIAEMLRQEYLRDFKLEPCNVAMNNVPLQRIPFNRTTVTIGINNQVIDFDTVLNQQAKVQETQNRIAWEIEKVKEEMEKVRIIQQAWYDDFRNNKYINDLSLADIRSRGIGDACAKSKEKPKTKVAKPKAKVDKSSDSNGVLLVKNAYCSDDSPQSVSLMPRSRYLMASNLTESSALPDVSI